MKKMINTAGALNTISIYTDNKEAYARSNEIREALYTLLTAEMISDEAFNEMQSEIAHHTQRVLNRNLEAKLSR